MTKALAAHSLPNEKMGSTGGGTRESKDLDDGGSVAGTAVSAEAVSPRLPKKKYRTSSQFLVHRATHKTSDGDSRSALNALRQTAEALIASPWGSIDIRLEEQARDFLVDMVLDDPQLVRYLGFAILLGQRGVAVLGLSQSEEGRLDYLHANAVRVITQPSMKRSGATLLHVSGRFHA